MQYFLQAFPNRFAYPDKYDLLMDIATEEFSHLEIVGATIQMLLSGVNGKLKEKADSSQLMDMLEGRGKKEDYIHDAWVHPHFWIEGGGGPMLTDSMGVPWNAGYLNANGDLTVDLRSNMGAESRAKIVYEYLMQFTDDPAVKETLSFLMTREITHFQQFEAALQTIEPNFPQGILQGDPRFSNKTFNMSGRADFRGPWNEGTTTKLGEEIEDIKEPLRYVQQTEGLSTLEADGKSRDPEIIKEKEETMAALRGGEVNGATPTANMSWSNYKDDGIPQA